MTVQRKRGVFAPWPRAAATARTSVADADLTDAERTYVCTCTGAARRP
jgi:hypothetical protein